MYILKKLSLVALFSLLFFNACPSDLIKAAKNGDINAVTKLFQQDINPNIQDNGGNTPLHWAVLNGHTEVVRLLLEKGADPNVKDNLGYTPLEWAARYGHIEIVKLLLQNGADPNTPYKGGSTPLLEASRDGYTEIVRLLLEKGANPNLQNGYIPLREAVLRGHIEIVRLIVNAIALDAVIAGTATCEQEEKIRTIITEGTNQDLLNMIAGRTLEYVKLNGFLKFNSDFLLLGLEEYIKNNQENYTTDIYRRVARILYSLAREMAKRYIVLSKESNFSSLPEEIQFKILVESYGLPESFLFTTIRTKSGNLETFEYIFKDYIAKIQSSHEQAAAQPQAGPSNTSEGSTKRLEHKQAAAQFQAGPSTED